jgi:hypothetical protein
MLFFFQSVNDIDDIGERVKCMNIVVRSEGHLLLSQANRLRTDKPTAIELYKQAILKFEEALDWNPHCAVLVDCASALQKLFTELRKSGQEDTSLLHRAEVYFQRAIGSK